ncbi:hypothetical protein [Microbispora sp. ATCC PTA-5024]|uniref:hypothetical protein n=1 Tax=Microbispora sp. ATCC PTA-5024 TaxID=316330 RepID=UPI0003DBC0DA|nr:hypothetical protein [Microbispora sp. ATCC PTA-5024]ETK36172.1 hypothetical protein MPTA5024_11135 [Microbispora sp. ATCC PTA-5024]
MSEHVTTDRQIGDPRTWSDDEWWDPTRVPDTEWLAKTGMCGSCGRDGSNCNGYCWCDRTRCQRPQDGRACSCRCGCFREHGLNA